MRILFVLILVLGISAAQAQSQQAVAAYVDRYKNIAIEEMKTYGIPASITLAQGIHESGCGASVLAQKSNNHFGIKCHEEWNGQTYHHDDDQPQECFRVYNCPEESFRDHSEFLKSRPRYASLFNLPATDYKSWARGLKAAGYATNPRYTDIIVKLIEDYNLTQFDRATVAPAQACKSDKKTVAEVDLIKQSLLQQNTPVASSSPATKKNTEAPATAVVNNIEPVVISQTAITEKVINGARAITYKKEIPIAFIAQKYNLSVQQLYVLNDMSPNDKFKDNDVVFVESKRTEATSFQYEVNEGETMHDIAQKFGIQLVPLLFRNGLSLGSEPVAGEIVVLKGHREVPIKFRVSNQKLPDKTRSESSLPADAKIHTVGSSETLYSIAKAYNVPVDTLKRLNGLKDEDIKIGQMLIVDL